MTLVLNYKMTEPIKEKLDHRSKSEPVLEKEEKLK